MERGSRRLLYDMDAVGRLSEPRLTAWERLEQALGPMTFRKLFTASGGNPTTGSAGRRRRVA